MFLSPNLLLLSHLIYFPYNKPHKTGGTQSDSFETIFYKWTIGVENLSSFIIFNLRILNQNS